MFSPTLSSNILIFGGTFDPIHLGHIKPIIDVVEKFNIHKVIYVPCHIPPHKSTPVLSPAKRLELVKLAVSEYDFGCEVEVSDLEITRSEPSYTVNTLAQLNAANPNAKLFFAMGMDSLLNLHLWHQWQKIVAANNIMVLNRPGFQLSKTDLHPEIAKRLGKTIHLFESTEVAISSTQIRAYLAKLKNVDGNVGIIDEIGQSDDVSVEVGNHNIRKQLPTVVLTELLRLKAYSR